MRMMWRRETFYALSSGNGGCRACFPQWHPPSRHPITGVPHDRRRQSGGEVFSVCNLKALRNAGSGLIWAAAASAIIVPSVLSWTTGDGRGFIWHFNDLALGTGAMGLAILGLGHVFAEGICLKTDSDQII